jgi:hypothetical protein
MNFRYNTHNKVMLVADYGLVFREIIREITGSLCQL